MTSGYGLFKDFHLQFAPNALRRFFLSDQGPCRSAEEQETVLMCSDRNLPDHYLFIDNAPPGTAAGPFRFE